MIIFTGDSIILSFFNEKSSYVKNSFLNVDIDSEEYEKILEIDKKFTSYFSVERNFEKICYIIIRRILGKIY